MSNLPRDIVELAKQVKAVSERHGLSSIKLTYYPRDFQFSLEIDADANPGRPWQGGSSTNLSADGCYQRLHDALTKEITHSATEKAKAAAKSRENVEAFSSMAQAEDKDAERLRALVPDLITELADVADGEEA